MVNQNDMTEFYKELSEEITKTMDNELICTIHQGNGWTLVSVNCTTDTKHIEILDWIKTHCKSRYHGRYELWVFESKQDAVLFNLRWN